MRWHNIIIAAHRIESISIMDSDVVVVFGGNGQSWGTLVETICFSGCSVKDTAVLFVVSFLCLKDI